jgi:hypothetical protein
MAHWPPRDEELLSLIRGKESPLLEKKQEWYDLSDQRAKGTLLKHLLAIANSTRGDAVGYLVFGVADDRHGGALVGLHATLDEAQLAQALRHYTQPVPEVLAHSWRDDGKLLMVLGVHPTDNWPYYASRDIEGALSSEIVYHRVGPTVSVMKPAQLEKVPAGGSCPYPVAFQLPRGDFSQPACPPSRSCRHLGRWPSGLRQRS